MKYRLEYIFASVLFACLGLLPMRFASYLGGWIARTLGPLTGAHRTAACNLEAAMPELTLAQRQRILRDMWDNLGRLTGEFPHLKNDALLRHVHLAPGSAFPQDASGVIFVSAHFGNWELLPMLASSHGVKLTSVYRPLNNPYIDRMIGKLRSLHVNGMLEKGPKGMFKMARLLKKRESLAMLVDQKMNVGIPVPFFHRDAMTAITPAKLALRYDMPIVPAYIMRKGQLAFEARIFPPLVYEKTGDVEEDCKQIMRQINGLFERWIREHPAQWFWVHNRWPAH